MKYKIYVAHLCFCLMSACSTVNVVDAPYFLNENLEMAYRNSAYELARDRSELSFSDGKVANNCSSYLELTLKYDLEESVNNQQVKSEYLVCDALTILLSATGLGGENVDALNLGAQLLSQLDLRSFPSSLSNASDEDSHTLKELYSSQANALANIAELQTEESAFSLEVVAVAKINDNIFPDWIVWVVDESKIGNYRGYGTLIIFDPGKKNKFRAIAYP